MALQITGMAREFKMGDMTLDDPNPDFTPEEVKEFYAASYPELTTGTVVGPEIEGDKAVYTLGVKVGVKG